MNNFNINHLVSLVGNKKIYSIEVNRKMKFAIRDKITPELLKQHMDGKIRLGSYYSYQTANDIARDKKRCSYVCMDIDVHKIFGIDIKKYPLHMKKEEFKKELNRLIDADEEKVDILISRCEDFLSCDKKYLIKERSRHGLHVWIILKPHTYLHDTFEYVQLIKDKVENHFGKEIEFFPKQGNTEFGNFVWLPNPLTSEVYSAKVNKFNISSVLMELRAIVKSQNRLYERSNQKNHKEGNNSLYGIIKKSVPKCDQIINKVAPKVIRLLEGGLLGKCVEHAIKGELKLHGIGDRGEHMRLHVATRLAELGCNMEEVVSAFVNLSEDFNPQLTYNKILQMKHGYHYGCRRLKGMKFCDNSCINTGSIYEEETIKEKRPQTIHSWEEIRETIEPLLAQKDVYFFRKTTRSGTTFNTIIETLRQKKKLWIIAPTHKIFDETVINAVAKGQELGLIDYEPKLYKLSSNDDLCQKLKDELEIYPDMKAVFPFLLKGNCKECEFNGGSGLMGSIGQECQYMKFREEMEDYDLIYMSTQKFKAICSLANGSLDKFPNSTQELLNELVQWSDVLFIDECNHLLTVNINQMQIAGLDNRGNRYHYLLDLGATMTSMGNMFVGFKQTNFYKLMYEIVDRIEKGIKDRTVDSKSILASIRPQKKEIKFIDWYRKATEYYKKTRDQGVKNLIEMALALQSNIISLRHRKHKNKEPSFYLDIIDNIPKIFRPLTNMNDKTIIITDATYPTIIDMKRVFPNIKIIDINDPLDTASKQKVIVCVNSDAIYRFGDKARKQDLLKFIREYKNNNTLIICQNIDIHKRTRNLILEEGFIEEVGGEDNITHFRSVMTIGVTSDKRRGLIIGSPYPPNNSYDSVAMEYISLGYTDIKEYEQYSKRLQNYDALSTFFQSVSRVKDPNGKIESEVFVYGINKNKIQNWFNTLLVATPEVMSIKQYRRDEKL